MSVTLGGITLSPNLHLVGIESAKPVEYSVRPLLGGNKVVQIDTEENTPSLELIARNDGNSKMGCYTKAQLDSLRTLAATHSAQTLVHPAGTYQVFILEFNVEQADEREAPSSTKEFHGSIVLQVQ